MIQVHRTYIKPILQCGVLIYGWTSKNVLKNLEKLTKRLIKIIFYKRSFESPGSLREEYKLYTVRELHMYELFKTLINILRCECKIATLSNLMTIQDLENLSRSRSQISTSKRSCVKNCLCTRLRRLLNLVLIIEPVFVDKVKNLKEKEIRKLAHNLLDNFILENETLMAAIFNWKKNKTTDYGNYFFPFLFNLLKRNNLFYP